MDPKNTDLTLSTIFDSSWNQLKYKGDDFLEVEAPRNPSRRARKSSGKKDDMGSLSTNNTIRSHSRNSDISSKTTKSILKEKGSHQKAKGDSKKHVEFSMICKADDYSLCVINYSEGRKKAYGRRGKRLTSF